MVAKGRWGGKHDLTWDEYHAVPERWSAMGMSRQLEALGGKTGSGAVRSHRSMWYELADGVRAGDAASVEMSVRFIEERLIASYSGFARARLARALKHAELSPSQRTRLSSHFLALLESGDRTDEFADYLRLWPSVISQDHRERACRRAAVISSSSEEFARRVISALERDPDVTARSAPSNERRPHARRINKARWVHGSLSLLKAQADAAGASFRDAKRRLARANLDYQGHLVLRRYVRPISTAGWELTPERLAAAEARSLETLRQLDEQRSASGRALERARSHLEQATAAFRAARESRG